jgi:hypothetical protein
MEVALFGAGLAVALYCAVVSRHAGLMRTGSVLICNWLVLLAVVTATGKHDPVAWFLVVDFLSALLVLWHPASRPQAAIGLIYMVQIGVHFARYPGGGAGTTEYLQLLALGGWLQIAFLILGAVDGTARKVTAGDDRRGHAGTAVAAGAARVEAGAE